MIHKFIVPVLIAIMLATASCNMPGLAPKPAASQPPPTQAPTLAVLEAVPPVEDSSAPLSHVDIPTRGGGKAQVVHDQLTKDTAPQKKAYGGDDFTHGRLERPFSRDMVYMSYLDIAEANMVWDQVFVYFMIRLVGTPNTAEGYPPVYGIEIDTDLDSRGNILLLSTAALSGEWTQQGVQVWEDTNGSVGGETAVESDPPAGAGDGYESKLFEAGLGASPDLAWARLDPLVDTRVELAIHRSLFQEYQKFNSRAYADGLLRDNTSFDPNDRFTIDEAGSAEDTSPYYPLKAFYAYDNTCIAPYNYRALGGEPGLCQYIPPVLEASATTIPGAPPLVGVVINPDPLPVDPQPDIEQIH